MTSLAVTRRVINQMTFKFVGRSPRENLLLHEATVAGKMNALHRRVVSGSCIQRETNDGVSLESAERNEYQIQI